MFCVRLRLQCTVNDVLDFRKLDTGMFRMVPEEIHLWSFLERAMGQCQFYLQTASVTLNYRFGLDMSDHVRVDGRRLMQLLTNGFRYADLCACVCPWVLFALTPIASNCLCATLFCCTPHHLFFQQRWSLHVLGGRILGRCAHGRAAVNESRESSTRADNEHWHG
jgi:hypothetical protein